MSIMPEDSSKKEKPHSHYGYLHDENGTRKPDASDRAIIDKVNRIWQNKGK